MKKTTTTKTTPAPKASVKVKKAATLVAPPAPEAKTEAKTLAATPAKASGPSRNKSVGQFGEPLRHMRIMEYQDYTFSIQATRRLTDDQLAADWQTQFPSAVKFSAYHVVGARRDYNAGTHSKAFDKPKVAVQAFGADGKPTVVIAKNPKAAAESKAEVKSKAA